MPRLAALLLAALTAATCRAATHTVYWAAATGGTYYAFPSSQSLDDWTTYRVQLSEGAGANVGRYTGSLDDAHGTSWFLFSGSSQPASWGASVGATTLVVKANAVKIEDADATDTLGTAQTGDSYALLGAPVGASVSADIAAILDDTGTSGVVVAAGTEIEVADADLRAALGMAAADLDTQLDAIVADTNELQTDWVNGGRLDLLVDAIKSITDQFGAAQAEPTGVPAANETPLDKLAYVFMMLRNKITVTADTKTYFDDGGAAEFKKGLTDDGTTYTEAEAAAP